MEKLYTKHETTASYVGIDISKNGLDVHIHPTNLNEHFNNDLKGFRALEKWLISIPITMIIFESTGRYHHALHVFLDSIGYQICVINPCRSRRFAQALGYLAKTDKADAKTLAQYGAMTKPEATPLCNKDIKTLRELIVARRALLKRMTQITNHIQDCHNSLLKRQSQQAIKQCERHLAQIDQEMEKLIRTKPALKQRFDILTSIPAIGPATAFTLIAEMPELGSMTAKQASSLIGLAPVAQDSGMYRGRRKIKAGRRGPRMALYMAAVAALRFNQDMAKFYTRLKGNGKPSKVALIAVMRKMIVLANTLIGQQRKWEANCP
jgi:transposase